MVSLTATKGSGVFWECAERLPDTGFLGVRGSYGYQVVPDEIPPNVTLLDCMDGRRMRDEVYAETRILLVPSDYESWGRVATEAMCSGIPVIANPAEGALAENLGDAAIWADRDKPEEWVAQIRRLAKPAAWEKASEAASKRYAELDPVGDLERWCAAVEALAR
jgi:glycosyltransferase involved in cell wall biosynthesis